MDDDITPDRRATTRQGHTRPPQTCGDDDITPDRRASTDGAGGRAGPLSGVSTDVPGTHGRGNERFVRRRFSAALVVAVGLFAAFTLSASAESVVDAPVIPPQVAPFLVGADGLARSAGTGHPASVPLSDILIATVDSLDDFWADEIRRVYAIDAGPRPGLAPYWPSSGSVPPCGTDLTPELAARQAFYCSLGDFIGWDAEYLIPEAHEHFDPIAPSVILAHEWAHAVQARASIDGPSLFVEVQADCFAGAWLAGSTSPLIVALRNDFLDQAPRFFAWIGDPHDGSIGDTDRHGTAGERLDAFRDGYQIGTTACALYETAG